MCDVIFKGLYMVLLIIIYLNNMKVVVVLFVCFIGEQNQVVLYGQNILDVLNLVCMKDGGILDFLQVKIDLIFELIYLYIFMCNVW